MQRGHTPAEHTVYDFLWRAAGKWGRADGADARRLRFKQPWLAETLGMHENSIRSILKRLREKLAIEETDPAGPAQGRELRIYSPAALLARRQERGLVWAVRSHGVRLLTAAEVARMADPCLPVGTDVVPTETLDDL